MHILLSPLRDNRNTNHRRPVSIGRALAPLPVVAMLALACNNDAARTADASGDAADRAFNPYTIHVDRPASADAPAGTDAARPRKFAFRVTGSAPLPADDAAAEDRIAAEQAAVIEAFRHALIESRRAQGKSAENFTVQFSPRLSVQCRSTGDSVETTVSLLYRGIKNRLVVRDGILQHPPVDLRIIRGVFDETDGQFALLDTEPLRDADRIAAAVACYQSSGFDATPRNVARSDDDAD